MNVSDLISLWEEGGAPVRYARVDFGCGAYWTLWTGGDNAIRLSCAPWLSPLEGDALTVDELKALRFLAPCEPNKVVGLAHNYKSLVGDLASYPPPLIFLKGANALTGYDSFVPVPDPANLRTWQEVELAMVVGKRAANVVESEAGEIIFGFTIANDVSCENLDGRDHHLAQSKSRDGFCPCGPFLVPGVDTGNLSISSSVNDMVKQAGSTADRLITDLEAVAYVSQFMTLEPGDLIITGTCDGWKNTTLVPGCRMEVSIEGLGTLRNRA